MLLGTFHHIVGVPKFLNKEKLEIKVAILNWTDVLGPFELNVRHEQPETLVTGLAPFWAGGKGETILYRFPTKTTCQIPTRKQRKNDQIAFKIEAFINGNSVATSEVQLVPSEIEDRTLKAFFIPTRIGNIGMTIQISDRDQAGYRERAVRFLSAHNPEGVDHVDRIIEKVCEADLFPRLRKRYGLIDCRSKLQEYLAVYRLVDSARLDECINALLSQWDSREEELLRTLTSFHGPEPCDIDRFVRLFAFYHLMEEEIPSEQTDSLQSLTQQQFESLVNGLKRKWGPEPSPTTYLFSNMALLNEADLRATQTQTRSKPLSAKVELEANVDPSSSDQDHRNETAQHRPVTSSTSHVKEFLASTTKPSKTIAQETRSRSNSWSEFLDRLRRAGVQEDALFYLNDARFKSLLDELKIDDADRATVVNDWQRRLVGGTQLEFLHSTDPLSLAAVNDLLASTGLSPLQCQVHAVTRISNLIHEECFRRVVQDSGAVAKCYALGDPGKAMEVAFHGFQTVPVVFHKNVLRRDEAGESINRAILLCDVYEGNCRKSQGELELHRQEGCDSIRSFFDTPREELQVRTPQQVLPRLLLWVTFQVGAEGCQYHPTQLAVNRPTTPSNSASRLEPPMCAECFTTYLRYGPKRIVVRELESPWRAAPSVWPTPAAAKPFADSNPLMAGATEEFLASQPVANDSGILEPTVRGPRASLQTSPLQVQYLMRQDTTNQSTVDVLRSSRELEAKEMIVVGWKLFRAGNLSAAAAEWLSVANHFPGSASAEEALGIQAEVMQRDYKLAVEHYLRGTRLETGGHSASLFFRLGNLLESKLHDPEGARRAFQRASALGDLAAKRRLDRL